MHPSLRNLTFIPVVLACAFSARAADLTSASFRMRAAHEASIAARALPSAGPRFSASGVALGQGDAVGFAAGFASLETSAPGFWPIAAGGFPHHDADGDGIGSWLDTDDDGDGLLDAVETDTGLFLSPSNTGTSAVDPDSDDDSFDDGTETDGGSDPNDSESTPAPPQVPLLPGAALPALFAALALTPRALRSLRRRSTC
jgi:hypothetical protein